VARLIVVGLGLVKPRDGLVVVTEGYEETALRLVWALDVKLAQRALRPFRSWLRLQGSVGEFSFCG
jgi:hypothetical protein